MRIRRGVRWCRSARHRRRAAQEYSSHSHARRTPDPGIATLHRDVPGCLNLDHGQYTPLTIC
jgi:hypothetical protein